MKKVMLDIDGVLNDFPKTFINFCNDKLNTDFLTIEEVEKKLSYNLYRKLKKEYKFSDYKHKAKIKFFAKELVNYLKKENYLIYIVTARELFEKNQLDLTISWLKENEIDYDFLDYEEQKELSILEKFHHFDIVIEDTLKNIINIKNINGNALYFYVNENNLKYDNIINVENLKQIKDFLEGEKTNEI